MSSSVGGSINSIITNGLKMYLDASNPDSYSGSGTLWKDLSGNNFHGTLVAAPAYTAYTSSTTPASFYCAASSYVSIQWPGIKNLGGQATILMLVKIPSTQGPGALLFSTCYADGSRMSGWGLGLEPSGTTLNVRWTIGGWNTQPIYLSTAGVVTLNTWRWVAVTLTNATTASPVLAFYVDGVAKGVVTAASTTIFATLDSDSTAYAIGRQNGPAAGYFYPSTSYISTVLLFNRVLTADEQASIVRYFNARQLR